MKLGASCGLLAALVLVPAGAPAQMTPGAPPETSPEPTPPPSPAPSRDPVGLFGVVGLGGIPLGHFGEVVGAGFGVSTYGMGPLRRGQRVGLRLDFSYLEYGSETIGATVADTGGRVRTDRDALEVTTVNDFLRFALGPQVAARRGRLRPYAYATVGASYFSTTSKLHYGSHYDHPIESTTNWSDWTLSWSAGGGVLIRVSRQGFLELGVRYLANRPVDWLAEGDLDPAQPQPRHSAVNLVEIVVGIAAAP